MLWFGDLPAPAIEVEFENRGLSIANLRPEQLSDADLISVKAAVYHFTRTDITDVRRAAELTVHRTINHGITPYFLAENDTIQGYLTQTVEDLGLQPELMGGVRLKPLLERKTAPSKTHEIAEHIARLPVGRAYSASLLIEPLEIASALDKDDLVLLRRAFSDCSRLQLVPLTPGRTANVFRAHATFSDSVVGLHPLAFFVKLGVPSKIGEEIDKYHTYATHFVPFYLRPNLDVSRCLLGHTKGLLVGNFVDRSEPLWQLIQRGQAGAAIHSLFEVTLNGWRWQAYEGSIAGLKSASVAGGLASEFNYKRVQPAYTAFARSKGIEVTPQQLWETLISLSEQCYREAPMHGDLHGANVQVRNGDAILIDLASVRRGPLAADLASLETSILFDLPAKELVPTQESWMEIIDKLSAQDSFEQLPTPLSDVTNLSWMWNSARQVRMIALPTQACPTEYATSVAVYLLRRTMYAADSPVDTMRRGYAYVTAAKLIEWIKQVARA